MMGQGYGSYSNIGMGGGSTMMILFFLTIGAVVYLLINQQNTGGKRIIPQPVINLEALDIAKSRLANGEISIEEFEQIKKNLL